VPVGFVVLFLDQCTRPRARLEVSAKDLGTRGAQLLADQGLHGPGLIFAVLLVVWRVGHH
jgi:hypothetical protein